MINDVIKKLSFIQQSKWYQDRKFPICVNGLHIGLHLPVTANPIYLIYLIFKFRKKNGGVDFMNLLFFKLAEELFYFILDCGLWKTAKNFVSASSMLENFDSCRHDTEWN